MPKQSPLRPKGLDKTGEKCGEAEWYNDVPPDQIHREIRGTHNLKIVTGQPGDGERKVGDDRAEPADGKSDMREKEQFA